MDIETVVPERRRLKRFTVRGNAIAVIQSTPAVILGQIQDISPGGLSFSYLYSDERPDDSATLDIFLPDDKTHIKGFTFRTVSNCIVLNDNPFSTVIMNRRGIQFKNLTARLKSELERIIQRLAREGLGTGSQIYNIKRLAHLPI